MTTPEPAVTDPADIPVLILCGGMGTRLREASEKLPKPLVDIGGRPILWHIMKTYGHYGFRRFVLALGYKSDLIKQYFLNYRTLASDFTLSLATGQVPTYHNAAGAEDWEITFAETGLLTGTGTRIRRASRYLDGDRFAVTYGDGIGDVRLDRLLAAHQRTGTVGTLTGVHPSSRYGEMHVRGSSVVEFNEKPTLAEGWVNGGFFLFERDFLSYLSDDPDEMLESRPLQTLARDGELSVYEHTGFWMGMDTFRDWTDLNERWDAGAAPWKVWADTDHTAPAPL